MEEEFLINSGGVELTKSGLSGHERDLLDRREPLTLNSSCRRLHCVAPSHWDGDLGGPRYDRSRRPGPRTLNAARPLLGVVSSSQFPGKQRKEKLGNDPCPEGIEQP